MTQTPIISNRVQPASILRLYIWELLQAHELLSKIQVQTPSGPADILPVIPIEDEPKVANSGKTYIIYGFGENQGGNLNEIKNGAFSIRVVSDSTTEIGEITTTISRAFEDEDKSAANVNAWSSIAMNGVLIGIRFTWLNVSFISSPEPPDTEGGKGYGIMNISYRYISKQKSKRFNDKTDTWEYWDEGL